MSLTRKSLKAMGLTDEQIDSVVEMHTETISGLKEKLDSVENNVETVEKLKVDVEKYKTELEDAKKIIADGEKYKEMYENEKSEYEKYKNDITAKETQAAKESAVWNYLKDKGIPDKRKAAVMRGIKDEIANTELTEKGKIKNTKVFDDLIGENGVYYDFIPRTEIVGANPQVPPPNANGKKVMTWEDIDKIKDVKERQQAMYENREALGIK